MPRLSDNWITENHIDFEYKKYILLAYFQEVRQDFNMCRLYPDFSDLLNHYNNVLAIKKNKNSLATLFPKKLTAVDTKMATLQYKDLLNDSSLMSEIESIVAFSLPKFKYYMDEGKKIYDFIEGHLNLMPVGMMPLHIHEGYLLLRDAEHMHVKIYQYFIKLYNDSNEKYRAIYTDYVTEYKCEVADTFDSIKLRLLDEYKEWPNPATFAIDTDIQIPFEETYLPIAKRMLVRHVSKIIKV